jgi:hypothetical protein
MPEPTAIATFRITYEQYAELRGDMDQMMRGGLLVKVPDTSGLGLETPVSLELVLPDGSSLATDGSVMHVFPGVGVAVSIGQELLEAVRDRSTGEDRGGGPASHQRVDGTPPPPPPRARPATAAPPTSMDSLTNAEKIQVALHGNRDQRNAILRDPNRTLHPFVLKNPALTTEDVLAMAKNAQMTPELLKQIAERKEWFQRPQIALALARNPKTPQDVGIRALDHVPQDALRLMAKGTGAMPHIVQAARRKVVK